MKHLLMFRLRCWTEWNTWKTVGQDTAMISSWKECLSRGLSIEDIPELLSLLESRDGNRTFHVEITKERDMMKFYRHGIDHG